MYRDTDSNSKDVKIQGIAGRVVVWAKTESAVRVLVLIGSRARGELTDAGANCDSDWDFQIITSRPEEFATGRWTVALGLPGPVRYIYRRGRLDLVDKVTIISSEGIVDLVILPYAHVLLLRMLLLAKLHRRVRSASKATSSFAAVLKGGFALLKGSEGWRKFLNALQNEGGSSMLDQKRICALADGFYSDYLSTCAKIRHGELLAAQRWLHCNLAEVNFRLLQEVNERAGLPGFPDARRLERYCDASLLKAVTVAAYPNVKELSFAVEQCVATHKMLVKSLVGDSWQWPEAKLSLSSE